MPHSKVAGDRVSASIISPPPRTARNHLAPASLARLQDDQRRGRPDHHERVDEAGGRTLTRIGLARAIVSACDIFSLNDAKFMVDGVIEEVISALARGENVRLRNFGAFSVRLKAARPGRNPRTGTVVPISARKVVTFRASPNLRAVVNATEQQKILERRGDAPLRLIDLEGRATFRRLDSVEPPQPTPPPL